MKFAYYVSSIISLSANILCVANTTFLSVWGTGLAMRGPDGSMARAVDGMYQLRRNVFSLFGLGMMALLVTAIFGSWILMNAEARVRIHDGAPGPPEHPAPSWMRQCSRSLLSTRVENWNFM